MISFKSGMNNEKIAMIALVVIIAGALSLFLVSTYGGDMLNNLFDDTTDSSDKGDNIIEEGDCADVRYIERYASNGTIIDSTYENPESKTGGNPANIFVTTTLTQQPPAGYSNYSANYIEGLLSRLIDKKEGETYTFEIPSTEAYGERMEVGDVISLSEEDVGQDLALELYEIRYDAPVDSLPSEFRQIVSGNVTDIYVLRQDYEVGEKLTMYPAWVNKTVITKVNETKAWFKTDPSEENMTDFTWMETDPYTGAPISYWEGVSDAVIDEANNTIIVTHSPEVGQSMTFQSGQQSVQYTVVELNETKINCSYTNPQTGSQAYQEFERVQTIKYNQSQNITLPYPESLMSQFLDYIKQVASTPYSLSPYAGETIKYEVMIENVYKTSSE